MPSFKKDGIPIQKEGELRITCDEPTMPSPGFLTCTESIDDLSEINIDFYRSECQSGLLEGDGSISSLSSTSNFISIPPPVEDPSQYIWLPDALFNSGIVEACFDDDDMAAYMLAKETNYMPENYLEGTTSLDPLLRSSVFAWMQEVTEKYGLKRETWHMSVNFMDRFLSTCQSITTKSLQLFGAASVLVASKIEEISSPRINQLVITCAKTFEEKDLIEAEKHLINVLEWKLQPKTPYFWVKFFTAKIVKTIDEKISNTIPGSAEYDHFSLLLDSSLRMMNFLRIMELVDIAVMDVESFRFTPSMTAASAMLCVLPFGELVEEITSYRIEELKECILWIHSFQSLSFRGPMLAEIIKQYSRDDFCTKQTFHPQALSHLGLRFSV